MAKARYDDRFDILLNQAIEKLESAFCDLSFLRIIMGGDHPCFPGVTALRSKIDAVSVGLGQVFAEVG